MDITFIKDIVSQLRIKLPQILLVFGLMATLSAVAILILTFYPVWKVEVNYAITSKQSSKEIIPRDRDFGIVVPKIRANSKVIADVNPYNDKEYQVALTKGVAHAKGTVYPGQEGNSFIFSHSSVNFYEATRYNSVFYLLSKLEKGDEVDLYYKGQKFVYKVTEKVLADPNDLSYLTRKTDKKMVTLMTCWPPGTTFKRLLVIGELLAD